MVIDKCMKNDLFHISPTAFMLLDTEIDNDLYREPKRIKLNESSDLSNSIISGILDLVMLDGIKRLAKECPMLTSALGSHLLVNPASKAK